MSSEQDICFYLVANLAAFRIIRSARNFLVGLFIWVFYDGGSRENEGGLGTKNPYKKLFSHYLPTTMFELGSGRWDVLEEDSGLIQQLSDWCEELLLRGLSQFSIRDTQLL